MLALGSPWLEHWPLLLALITLSLFLSCIATIQYASGPVIEINMNYDLDSFKWVYDQVKNDAHPCIIGDTIHTIIFEYISHNKISQPALRD